MQVVPPGAATPRLPRSTPTQAAAEQQQLWTLLPAAHRASPVYRDLRAVLGMTWVARVIRRRKRIALVATQPENLAIADSVGCVSWANSRNVPAIRTAVWLCVGHALSALIVAEFAAPHRHAPDDWRLAR